MKTIQIIFDIIALILFAVSAFMGLKVSPLCVVCWILIAMIEHIGRED